MSPSKVCLPNNIDMLLSPLNPGTSKAHAATFVHTKNDACLNRCMLECVSLPRVLAALS